MNTKTRYATLFGLAAGLVLIPIIRALMRRSRNSNTLEAFSGAPPNNLFSAYRGKFRPHRRKATGGNGVH